VPALTGRRREAFREGFQLSTLRQGAIIGSGQSDFVPFILLGAFERTHCEPAQKTNTMKIILSLAMVALGLSAHAGILSGPIVNPLNGHSYYLLSQNTWSNAETEAVSLGGHLATIRNEGENQWVFSTFGSYGGALWIGLTDRQKVLQFTWTSGEPVSYTNWGGGQPDNCNGVEFYAHMLPRGHYAAGKWNDYENAETVLAAQFPLYGVAEILPASSVRLSLPAPSNTRESATLANPSMAATTGPELHAFTAIELSWSSETNTLYRIQWTPSLDPPQWSTLEPIVSGTGTIVSVFDSTRQHPRGFYRVRIVQ